MNREVTSGPDGQAEVRLPGGAASSRRVAVQYAVIAALWPAAAAFSALFATDVNQDRWLRALIPTVVLAVAVASTVASIKLVLMAKGVRPLMTVRLNGLSRQVMLPRLFGHLKLDVDLGADVHVAVKLHVEPRRLPFMPRSMTLSLVVDAGLGKRPLVVAMYLDPALDLKDWCKQQTSATGLRFSLVD